MLRMSTSGRSPGGETQSGDASQGLRPGVDARRRAVGLPVLVRQHAEHHLVVRVLEGRELLLVDVKPHTVRKLSS